MKEIPQEKESQKEMRVEISEACHVFIAKSILRQSPKLRHHGISAPRPFLPRPGLSSPEDVQRCSKMRS